MIVVAMKKDHHLGWFLLTTSNKVDMLGDLLYDHPMSVGPIIIAPAFHLNACSSRCAAVAEE